MTSNKVRPALEDDDVSINSPEKEVFDGDKEFEVRAILAEKKVGNQMHYLIDWAGYPREEASWEPRKNIQDKEIFTAWEQRKREEAAGIKPKFKMADFDALLEKVAEDQKRRHRIRKIKRKRLGLPVSPSASDSDSTEARETDEEPEDHRGMKRTTAKRSLASVKPPKSAKAPVSAQKRKAEPNNKLFSSKPSATQTAAQSDRESSGAESKAKKRAPQRSVQDIANQRSSKQASPTEGGDQTRKIARTSTASFTFKWEHNPQIKEELEVTLGVPKPSALTLCLEDTDGKTRKFEYPGEVEWDSVPFLAKLRAWYKRLIIEKLGIRENLTSISDTSAVKRQPVAPIRPVASMTSTRPSVPSGTSPAKPAARTTSTAGGQAPTSLSSTAPTGRGQGARRGVSVASKNVFSGGGTVRKSKPTLAEQASDPTKAKKGFSNMHIQNVLLKQTRAKADRAPDLDAIGGLFDPSNPDELQLVRPSNMRKSSAHVALQIPDQAKESLVEQSPDSMEISPVNLAEKAKADGFDFSENPWRKPDTSQVNPPLVCFYWRNRGSCTKGPRCDFLHDDNPDLPVASQPFCRSLREQGSCPYGDSCYFSHDTRRTVCEYHVKGYCIRGDACTFAHPQASGTQQTKPTSSNAVATANTDPFVDNIADTPMLDRSESRQAPPDQVSNLSRPAEPRRGVSFVDEPESLFMEPEPYSPPTITPKKVSVDSESNILAKPPRHIASEPKSFAAEVGAPPLVIQSYNKEARLDHTCRNWKLGLCHFGDRCWYNHFYYHTPGEDVNGRSQTLDPNHIPVGVQRQSVAANFPLGLEKSIDSPINRTETIMPLSNTVGTSASTIPRKKLTLTDYQQGKITQVTGAAGKKILFGEKSQPIVLNFGNIIEALQEPWGASFSQLPSLQFDHLCTAQDFQAQRNAIVRRPLWQGNVKSDPLDQSTLAILENVAQHMRLNSGGLLSTLPDFSMLIYPPLVEWTFLDGNVQFESSTSLRYFVYETGQPTNHLLTAEAQTPLNMDYKKALVRKIHGLSFKRLLPKQVKDKFYHFYLLFPPSAAANATASFLISWMQDAYPLCKFYSCQTEGSWDYFVHSREIEYGIVLVHETAVMGLSELPHLKTLMMTRQHDTFWYIGDSSSPFPLFSPPLDATIGQVTATRLLAFGVVILLTPSLFVADPETAHHIIKWFREKAKTQAPGSYKLVCCHNVLDYLLGLAHEKTSERDKFELKHRGNPKKDAMLDSAGLSWKICENRFACYKYLSAMVIDTCRDGYSTYFDADYPDETMSTVIYAPEGIDSDDERGLASWFAGWSLTKLDQFRRFAVVGTGPGSKQRAVRAKEITMQGPSRKASLTKHAFDNAKAGTDINKGTSPKPSVGTRTASLPVPGKLTIEDVPHSSELPSPFLVHSETDTYSPSLPPGQDQNLPMQPERPVSRSGIVTDANGQRFVPSSVRPAGTMRAERPVRPGFIPIEDKDIYQNRRVVDGIPQYELNHNERGLNASSPPKSIPKSPVKLQSLPAGTIRPGTILKATTSSINYNEDSLDIEKGDDIEILSFVSDHRQTYLAKNLTNDGRKKNVGQLPAWMFQIPKDEHIVSESEARNFESRNGQDAPTARPAFESIPAAPPQAERSPTQDDRMMADIDLQKAIQDELNGIETDSLESSEDDGEIHIIKREIRFEPTTQWYARQMAEGTTWEHIFVDTWEKCQLKFGMK